MTTPPPADTARPDESPRSNRADAVEIIRTLRAAGHVAYLAGGCVRDELLGLAPKDFDVATDAPPDRVRRLFPRTQPVGAAFGVILVRHGGSVIEVATFRADGDYRDGRHPENVRFSTPEDDARRRDFTVNALFLDPLDANRVIDHVGGLDDLRARTLRAVGEPRQRFAEDYLRMLRAARFASRLGFTIDPATADAVVEHASRLAQISPERINDELQRMLTPPTRVEAWRLLWKLHLTPVLFRLLQEPVDPDAVLAGGAAAPAMLFPQVGTCRSISAPLALASAVLCYRRQAVRGRSIRQLLEPGEVRRSVSSLRRALRLSNDDSEGIAWCLRFGQLLGDQSPTVATIKRFMAQPHADDARALLRALATTDTATELSSQVAWVESRVESLIGTEFAPERLVTGDDLIAAGLSPGPLFKRVLEQAYDEQLEGRLTTREEALLFAITAAARG